MLRGIIGNDDTQSPPPPPPLLVRPQSPKAPVAEALDTTSKDTNRKTKKKDTDSDDSSPERLKNKVMESLKRNKGLDDRKQKASIKIESEER